MKVSYQFTSDEFSVSRFQFSVTLALKLHTNLLIFLTAQLNTWQSPNWLYPWWLIRKLLQIVSLHMISQFDLLRTVNRLYIDIRYNNKTRYNALQRSTKARNSFLLSYKQYNIPWNTKTFLSTNSIFFIMDMFIYICALTSPENVFIIFSDQVTVKKHIKVQCSKHNYRNNWRIEEHLIKSLFKIIPFSWKSLATEGVYVCVWGGRGGGGGRWWCGENKKIKRLPQRHGKS